MTAETPGKGRALSPLRYLHDTQVSLEKLRISLSNRVSAIERGVDGVVNPIPAIYQRLQDGLGLLERETDEAIAIELKGWPVYNEWLRHVKGIGPSLSGQLLALLLPPIPEKGPSSWFKAAGLTPEVRPDGLRRLPRPRTGEGRVTYHPWLRRCLYNVATSFVRNGGYYRTVYDRGKAQLQELHRDEEAWPPHRVDSVARWRMVKLFLSHLWEAWCEADGIKRRPPYVTERLGHQYIPRPLPTGKGKI